MTHVFLLQQYDRHNPKKEEIVNDMPLLLTNCAADNNRCLLSQAGSTSDRSPHSVYFLIH